MTFDAPDATAACPSGAWPPGAGKRSGCASCFAFEAAGMAAAFDRTSPTLGELGVWELHVESAPLSLLQFKLSRKNGLE